MRINFKICSTVILFSFFSFIGLSTAYAGEVDVDSERLDGYLEYKEDLRNFEELRLSGKISQYEEDEQDRLQREEALKQYRAQKKKEVRLKKSDAYVDYLNEKLQDIDDRAAAQKEYSVSQQKMALDKKRKIKKHVSEEVELDLYSRRDRSDIRKRVLYGALPKFKVLRNSALGGGVGSSGGAPSVTNDDNFSFPNPPPPLPQVSGGFDDAADPGFIPPAPAEPFDPSEIPPPPPMPMDDTFLPPPDFGDF